MLTTFTLRLLTGDIADPSTWFAAWLPSHQLPGGALAGRERPEEVATVTVDEHPHDGVRGTAPLPDPTGRR